MSADVLMQMDGGEYAHMGKDRLKAQMLGECAFALGEIRIADGAKRASKVWLLLAYLICNRDRCIPQEELNVKLWGSEGEAAGSGVLKTTLWRVRQLLQPISEALGQEVIIRQGGAYGWNPAVALDIDAERMERLCNEAEADASSEIGLLRRAAALYAGDFLEKYSAEAWVKPISAYYYNLYLNSVIRLSELLPQESCAEEIEVLCRNALRVAPYQELLYQRLMRALMARGENEKAAEVYEEMRQRLFDDLGIQPGAESQAILRDIRSQVSVASMTVDSLRNQLNEKDPAPGALFCDYASFRLFYQAEARSASRRGDAVHVAMLSVIGRDGRELPARSLERTMEQLRTKILGGLRRGDVVSRCSASQFVVLLLQANYENSNRVCERLVRMYEQAYPRSAAQIRFTVLPLEPLPGWSPSTAAKKASWRIFAENT